jgi:exonuclease III
MKLISFNCRGLASPQTKSALKRLVYLHQPKVVLFQETLANELSATKTLSTLFLGWDFLGLDTRGRSRGLAIGWCSRSIKLLKSWFFDSRMGIEVQVEGFGLEIKIINAYGPHIDQIPF